MKIVNVTYTVKSEFVNKNKQNVDAFIRDIVNLNNPGIRYTAYLGEDGKTFKHLAFFDKADLQQLLFGLDSFKSFQKQRDESGLESEPKIEELQIVATSF